MDYRLFNLNITDENTAEIIESKIDFNKLDKSQEYDIAVDFYNNDLEDNVLDENISYEIKRKHYVFIKNIRNIFSKHGIKINKFLLMGTIADLRKNEMHISLLKTNNKKVINVIWPCKEIFIFEDSKNKLYDLFVNNKISKEDYELNLELLRDELSIYEYEEEHRYLN